MPSAWSAVWWVSRPGRPVVKAASAVPQMCAPSGVRTVSRPCCRLRTRSWSWTRPWSVSQSSTRLVSSVRPPKSQCRMWWACRRSMRVSGQPGRAQPPSRRSSARRWARVARRLRRPTARGSRPFSSMMHGGGRAEHPAGLGAGDRRAALDVGAAGGGVVGEHVGVDVHHDLPPRRVAGPAVQVTRASASAPRAAIRRAAVRSRTRPAASSSAQRSATARSTVPPAARICCVPGPGLRVLRAFPAGLAFGQGVDPVQQRRAGFHAHPHLHGQVALVVGPVFEGLPVLRPPFAGRLTGVVVDAPPGCGRTARSARRSPRRRTPAAPPRSPAPRCGSAPAPWRRTAGRRRTPPRSAAARAAPGPPGRVRGR